MTYGELEEQLCITGSKTLLEVLQSYEKGATPLHFAQNEHLVTFAKKIELEDCQIDWQKPAVVIHNLVRGVNPEPGAWCNVTVKGEVKRLKIKKTKAHKDLQGTPGAILQYGKAGFIIACEQGALEILELQLEGKKLMHSSEFVRGLTQDAIRFLSID